jgi:hypothetical protein
MTYSRAIAVSCITATNARTTAMASGKKYASISWPDLHLYISQLRATHDLDVRFEVDNTTCQGTTFRGIVKLYEGRDALQGLVPIKTASGPIKVAGDGQASQVMYLINLAYISYQGDPWNWTRRDRAREASGPTAG